MSHANTSPVQSFAVPAAPKRAWITLLLVLALPLGLSLLAGLAANAGNQLRPMVLVAAVCAPLGGFLIWALRRRCIRLQGGHLHVDAAMYRKRVPLTEIDLDALRVVNLEERTELRPRLKTNGFALPGYLAGHFRLADRRRAFCLVTDLRRVLLVPLREGKLLLSAEHPQALRDALRHAGAR
jgi:hypothetical protein